MNAHNMQTCVRLLLAVVLVGGCLLPDLAAQPGSGDDRKKVPLQLELRHEQIVRSSGPVPLEMDLIWNGEALLKGSLSVVLKDDTTVFSRAQSLPLVLNPGRTRVTMLLPTVEGHGVLPTIELVGFFHPEKGQPIELGSRPLRVPTQNDRLFRVLVCEMGTSFSGNSGLIKSLSFERFWSPRPGTNRANDQRSEGLTTYSSSIAPENLPTDPSWLCGYNIVVLRTSGLTRLQGRHVELLTKWVRAGGSILVETAESLDSNQIDLLNQLAGPQSPPLYLAGPDGKLEKPSGDYQRSDCGLGRSLIMHQPLSDDGSLPSHWDEQAAFLWQLRSDQVPSVSKTGKFRWLNADELTPDRTGHQSGNVIHDYNNRFQQTAQLNESLNDLLMVRDLGSGQGLLTRLMPDNVQVMPLEYIAGILFLYVLTIGPVDWFVLGAFKLRRLTWVTFPAATIGFTLFTVWLSHQFLDTSTERSAVTVFDMDQRGEAVRSNRLELLFTMSSHDVHTTVKSGLFTPLDHSRFGSHLSDNYGRQVSTGGLVSPPVFGGRPPVLSEVVQSVPQWTPHINRLFQIAPDQESLPDGAKRFDWKRDRQLADPKEVQALRDEVTSTFGPQAVAAVYHRRGLTNVVNNIDDLFQSVSFHNNWNPQTNSSQQMTMNFLDDMCAMQQGGGLFGIVKSIAPHGGDNFEDMTILDPSADDERLLVIGIPDDEETRIYRRLYRSSGAKPAEAVRTEDTAKSNEVEEKPSAETEDPQSQQK